MRAVGAGSGSACVREPAREVIVRRTDHVANMATTSWVTIAFGEGLGWMARLTRAPRFDRLGPDVQVSA